jgi:hypothetical protein
MNNIVMEELKRVLQPSYIINESITEHDRKFIAINLMYFFDNDYDLLFELFSKFLQIQEIVKDGGVPVAKQILKELEVLETKGEIEEMDKQVTESVGQFTDDNGRHYEMFIGEEKLSFFRIMLEEKGLDNEIIDVEHKDNIHKIEMDVLIDLMESVNKQDQKKIEETMRFIDFKNGDMMHYMKHLATGYVVTHY